LDPGARQVAHKFATALYLVANLQTLSITKCIAKSTGNASLANAGTVGVTATYISSVY
jgi:hypothetical protein